MPKTVFLDTHVFDTHCYDFDSPLLENFRSFASTGRINVVTTEVIAARFKDLDFFTPNEQGTVARVDDVKVRIDAHSFVTAPEGPSTIEATCHISFTAKVEYELGPDDDNSTANWENFDSDDLVFRDPVKQTVVRTAQVSIEHDAKNANSVQITDVRFDVGDVEVKWSGSSIIGN